MTKCPTHPGGSHRKRRHKQAHPPHAGAKKRHTPRDIKLDIFVALAFMAGAAVVFIMGGHEIKTVISHGSLIVTEVLIGAIAAGIRIIARLF